MDHARVCRGVVFRGFPGINSVMIGEVPALCENALSGEATELLPPGHQPTVGSHQPSVGGHEG